MSRLNKQTGKTVWLSALLLFVCVCATAAAVMNIFNRYQIDASDAILLSGDTAAVSRADLPATTPAPSATTPAGGDSGYTVPNLPSGAGGPDTNSDNGSDNSSDTDSRADRPASYAASGDRPIPGFEAGDEELIWSTETEVDLFLTEYANGSGEITVKSADGEKVIAPGTENSYTFKLQNSSYANLDYTVDVSALFATSNGDIPIEVRLSRYDGTWIVGDADTYIPVQELQHVEDSATLGRGKLTYYTLDWRWPFESDASGDALDTALGSVTVTQDLSFSLMIETTATTSQNPYPPGPGSGGGLDPAPKTGDSFNAVLWAVLAGAAAVNLVILILFKRRDEKRKEAWQ